ncbi:polysaccharide deacetylase family protein [Desulfonatronum thiodismutans]|uniref:polysaccharide deacetylase family protein n=1 Tax=Desulfonatronum thiodismutans TaxID=159290 RepID=UPI00068FAA33|nr:polysaccharide deacetylase family protein [Desulfonatronum thiodismutans]
MIKNYTSLHGMRELFQTGVPVLTYHQIRSCPWKARIRGLYVSPRVLNRQIAELKAAGFSFVDLPASFASRNEQKNVVLTFDDGYSNVLANAAPILQRHQAPAMLYVVAGMLGKTNVWDTVHGEVVGSLMTKEQVREWLDQGLKIGSHTMTHPHLPAISRRQAMQEIDGSRKMLEDAFQVPVLSFCYPYGEYTPQIVELVRQAGYQTAVTLDPGVNDNGQDPFLIKRFGVRRPMNPLKRLSRLIRGKEID